jgi:SAM-dependent methyltransferase
VQINDRVKDAARPLVVQRLRNMLPEVLPEMLPRVASNLMQVGQFWPHEYEASTFSRPIPADTGEPDQAAGAPLPVPPREFWADYCTSVESFLRSGREDVATMREILAAHDAPVENAGRVLELGCAGGRMIRWLSDLAENGAQVWGTDIWSSAVLWCQDHLNPPCHFATTTMSPHLPFEDRSFDLVYCGSLFTHIDDLAETWFAELHRILKPGGRLFFSLNDQHAVKLFSGEGDPDDYPRFYERTGGKHKWDDFVDMIEASPEYLRFRAGDAYMVTIGRSMKSHVMWNSDALARRLSYGYRLNAVTPASYGHQTTMLLERI